MIAELLAAQVPLLSLLGSNRVHQCLKNGHEIAVEAGDLLFQEGTQGDWAYVVLEGRVRVLRNLESRREVSFGVFGPGDLFGDYALISPHLNTATCRTASSGRLWKMPLKPLAQMIKDVPEVRRNLKRWLSLATLLRHLKGLSFLGFMSAPSALRFLEFLQQESFDAGLTIQTDALADDRWFYLEEGHVRLIYPGGSESLLRPGACFGERALAHWDGLPMAEAVTDVKCLSLAASSFLPLQRTTESSTLQTLQVGRFSPDRFQWIGQREESDCGLAALAMTGRHLGLVISIDDLRDAAGITDRGLSMSELRELAASFGLRAQAVRADADHLRNVRLPAIAHLHHEHYVVLICCEAMTVRIADPQSGIVTMSHAEFLRVWSRHLLLLTQMSAPGSRSG